MFLVFLEKTQQDSTIWIAGIRHAISANEINRINSKQLPRVVFEKTQDAHRARASELLESTGTARSIRCRSRLQVEVKLKAENGKMWMWKPVKTSLFCQQLCGPGARVPSLRRVATWDAYVGFGSRVFGEHLSTFGPQHRDIKPKWLTMYKRVFRFSFWCLLRFEDGTGLPKHAQAMLLRCNCWWESQFLRYLPNLGTWVSRSLAFFMIAISANDMIHDMFCIETTYFKHLQA